jgi:hypothetical protein
MARSSIALFLAASGLIAGLAGCGQAPEHKEQDTPGAGQAIPGGGASDKELDTHKEVDTHKEIDKDGHGTKGAEGGEGGEGGEG